NSAPAYLEIGSRSGTVSEDKFEDLFTGTSSFFGPLLNRPSPRAAIISVAAGTLDGQVLNNFNSTTQQGEANHCGVLTAATRWVGLVNTNGVPLTFIVDTTGSAIDTILAVYTGTSLSTLFNIACMKG